MKTLRLGVLSDGNNELEMHDKIHDLIESVGLKGLANEMAGNLPIGNLKKLEVAKALATTPKLLLLDEPFGGLSHAEALELIPLIKRINQQGVSIIVVEHVMSVLLKLVEQVLVLNFGKEIAKGNIHAVMSDRTVIEAYLGDSYVENN